MEDFTKVFPNLECKDEDSYGRSFRAKLEKPYLLRYELRGIEYNKEKCDDPELYVRSKQILNGVYDNFSLETRGLIQGSGNSPETKCNVEINPDSYSIEGSYVKYSMEGTVGYGWYKNEIFLLRIFLSPQQTQRLLEYRQIVGEANAGLHETERPYDVEESNSTNHWLNIEFDLVNCRWFTGKTSVEYEISRVSFDSLV